MATPIVPPSRGTARRPAPRRRRGARDLGFHRPWTWLRIVLRIIRAAMRFRRTRW